MRGRTVPRPRARRARVLRSDHGPELVCRAVLRCLLARGMDTAYITIRASLGRAVDEDSAASSATCASLSNGSHNRHQAAALMERWGQALQCRPSALEARCGTPFEYKPTWACQEQPIN